MSAVEKPFMVNRVGKNQKSDSVHKEGGHNRS